MCVEGRISYNGLLWMMLLFLIFFFVRLFFFRFLLEIPRARLLVKAAPAKRRSHRQRMQNDEEERGRMTHIHTRVLYTLNNSLTNSLKSTLASEV